jgi:GNAT superfamily N-acetyltransferase
MVPGTEKPGEDGYLFGMAGMRDLPAMHGIDDDAAGLYVEAGIRLDLPPDHPFVLGELRRWRRAVAAGNVYLAVAAGTGETVGFAALSLTDGAPYLEQLAVRRAHMRRGIGGELLERALGWARAQNADGLWLTTYAHLPWNAPFYARAGFVQVDEARCGPGVRAHLVEQRAALPHPGQRIAMRRMFDSAT